LASLNKHIRRFMGVETQSCIVVQNAQQIVLNLPDRISTDFCADITKCFENIPTDVREKDNLPAALKWAVQAAFSHQAAVRGKEQLLVISTLQPPYKVAWQHSSSGTMAQGKVYLTREKTLDVLRAAIDNAYVTAAGAVYRQIKGIPMGADYSPDACNLYFMSYEAAAVKRMCWLADSAVSRHDLCTEWLYCFRMMDDIRMINAPRLSEFLRNPDKPGD